MKFCGTNIKIKDEDNNLNNDKEEQNLSVTDKKINLIKKEFQEKELNNLIYNLKSEYLKKKNLLKNRILIQKSFNKIQSEIYSMRANRRFSVHFSKKVHLLRCMQLSFYFLKLSHLQLAAS